MASVWPARSARIQTAGSFYKKHNRVVTLSNQSLAFGKSIRTAQEAAKISTEKVLTLEKIAVMRWGNQFKQLKKNYTLRPGIDACLEKYKLENKTNKEAIVETNEDEQGSKVGNAVAASEIGLDLS
ncbi:hypothetical protein CYMTET_36745 [Cymbomonas tetramitiformis]|uniref:Uncharacterized protein n=1 Tax=Cymbomonas tetramitiformis TaxID=36881 RepID=A0AAE0CAS1_9CHLO|nr:hypothetical protein CYMTET_39097 [Cymbomonas tetramitiformis]KAK3254027.1 hypothetical protein CYMTET_36745 [Cymbomonas tetramitiformis]